MAVKIDKPEKEPVPKGAGSSPVPTPAAVAAAAELDALFPPDRRVLVGDERVAVEEITFVQSLQLDHAVQPIVAALDQVMSATGTAPSFRAVKSVLARHPDELVELLCASTGKDAAWVNALSANDGQALVMAFWGANAGFFVQAAADEIVIRREEAKLLAGASSSPPSSPMATAETTSAATPSGN